MKSLLRPTSIDDLEALRQFLAGTFGVATDVPFLDPIMMRWKYWDRRDDFAGPRSFVLEKDGVIIAHAGIWPMNFGTGEDMVQGVHMIDWAADKGSPGAGLSLVQRLTTMFQFIVAIGGSEMTRKVLPAFGFVECRRTWRGVQPLRPIRQILTHQYCNWKLGPRLVRNWMWSGPRSRGRYKNWRAVRLGHDQILPEIYQAEVAHASGSPRPPAFFEYLARCPVGRFELYGIFDDQEIMGHYAIGVLRGQARLAGVWLREPSHSAWAGAYCLARQTALCLKGANELVMIGSEGASQTGAAEAGFRTMKGAPVYLLDKKKKLPLSPQFQFQLSDDDAAYYDAGTASYWS